jgi:DNA (cytosine-5)-methyltransferase 1
MKVLSLFSGVGGFDMGLENAGMQTVFQCEWDKHANTILNKHWPDVPKWEDVSTLTGKHILTHAPVIDVVAWGSPCQDLSVAGKRSGLEGERSGLFHEGIRIIKELRKESNGQYPRISIWENVVGALNSNRGADFGIIINEMAEAGAMVIEWAVLDAQYFGVPQRRRRVFVIAIFDPAIAKRCPNPLLPVTESLPGHLAKGKPARKSATSKTAESIGENGFRMRGFGDYANDDRASAIKSRDYKDATDLVVENAPILIDRAAFNQGENAQYQPHISDDPISPSLVAQGPHAVATSEPMLIDGTRVDDVRIYEEPVQTLKERMGTGGNNVPMLAFDTQFGSNANVTENIAPTLKSSQAPPSVAYGIQGNMIGRQDHNGPAGKGHTEEGEPMFTLTGTDVHAVLHDKTIQYDGYNQRVNESDIAHSIRIGRDSSDFIAQPTKTAGFKPNASAESRTIGYKEELSPSLEAGGSGSAGSGVLTPAMAVRRLTPLECERLMGWPDDHTRWKADGTEQADTHRYKQCGNGVASPVAQWIGKYLLKIEEQQ